jgi:Methyltransferase domain
VKELDDVYHMPGMLTPAEVDCLFQLGQFNQRPGVIVEIGSWKGKSTVALARGSAKNTHEKIYAIDPHSILPEERYFEDTKSEFLANVARAGVKDRIIPMIMTSQEAARDWNRPIRLLWIDGDHRYEPAKLDFTLGSPSSSRGASSHSTILLENRVPSGFCGNTSFAPVDFRKSPSSTTLLRLERLIARPCRRDYGNTWTLALRAIYIASRKSRVPHSRTIGRKLLRRCTRQTWLPVILFVFSANIAR